MVVGRAGWAVAGETSVWIDFDAAVPALEASVLPYWSGERQILVIAASIAEGMPVDLRDALSGLDEAGVGWVVRAVAHAVGYATTPAAAVMSR